MWEAEMGYDGSTWSIWEVLGAGAAVEEAAADKVHQAK